MVTCLQRELNLSCFVFFRLYLFPVWLFLRTFSYLGLSFSIYFSDVALFCGFYSRRATLWPLWTLFCPTLNLPRVHWKLMAGSGTLLDPLWRKVPKSISRAHMYLGSAESFEGDSAPLFPSTPPEPSFSNILHEHWHGWLMWGRSLWTPAHVVITSLSIDRWSRVSHSLSLLAPFTLIAHPQES